jgi:hypothetical protein
MAEDVALRPVVDRDDVRPAIVKLGARARHRAVTRRFRSRQRERRVVIALPQPPQPARPAVGLPGGDFPGEVHALEAGPAARLGEQRVDVEHAFRAVRDHRVRRALEADQAGERARIDAGKADPPVRAHPLREALGRTEIGRLGHVLADHAAERVRIVRLDILEVGADIADMGKGEGDDLPRVGRIGHDLLVAGH